MNTDQAFELLKDAGVEENVCIQTVRRWLLERKVYYEAKKYKKTGYILDDTDQAFQLLKDAGVAPSIGMQIVKRWLREGKIQDVGDGNQLTEYISHETNSKRGLNNTSNQDRIIRQLQAKIKVQDEHINGIEELHQNSLNAVIQQREKLKKEIVNLESEKNKLQLETGKLLKDNLTLRKELIKLKEELSKGYKREPERTQTVPHKKIDYRRKLGLSKTADDKEVLAGYKKLLKITHPDQGGNEIAFHYIKMDYDSFRKSLKEPYRQP